MNGDGQIKNPPQWEGFYAVTNLKPHLFRGRGPTRI